MLNGGMSFEEKRWVLTAADVSGTVLASILHSLTKARPKHPPAMAAPAGPNPLRGCIPVATDSDTASPDATPKIAKLVNSLAGFRSIDSGITLMRLHVLLHNSGDTIKVESVKAAD